MLKPRTLLILAAIGAGIYALFRWQKQRLVAFDRALFTDTANKNLLSPSRNNNVPASSGHARPVPTTVHRSSPKARPITTTVHKGEPPKLPVKTEPRFGPTAHNESGNSAAPTGSGQEASAPETDETSA